MLGNSNAGGPPARFNTVRRLATVFWGDVHLAEQVGDGGVHKKVRIWTVRPDLCRDPEAIEFLREDLQRAGKLSPYSIAQILDVWEGGDGGPAERTVSFATEHLEGLTLREALDEAFYNDLDFQLPVIVAVALEVARALEYAHDRHSKARGLVHGDLRPELVLIGLEGAVKVAGFGLSRFLKRANPNGEWCTWKQRCYQPPEGMRPGVENPRADLCSLGLMILEALCSRPDLTGDELREILSRLESGTKMTMSCGQEVPTDVAQVILRACSAKRGDRYLSATQMATDLHLLLLERRHVRPTAAIVKEAAEELVPGPDREKTLTDLSASILDQEPLSEESTSERITLSDLPLVGRENVLEQIAQVLEETAAGVGQVIVLRGEPGVGRTRILSEVAVRLAASARKHAWLHIASSRAEHEVQFSGVLRLLASTMGLRWDVDLVTVGQEAERLRAHGVGSEAISAVRAVVGLEAPPERSRLAAMISEAVIRCVHSLSWEQATVVAWDDLQWADHASLGCILELLTRFSDMPAMALVTIERAFKPPWALPEGSKLVELGPLSSDECEQFVVQMGWGQQVDATLLERLVSHTGGNPQHLEEVVDLLSESERLEIIDGRLTILGAPDTPLPRLEDGIIARLRALDEDATFVAVTAAVAGPALTMKLLSTATGIPVDKVEEILDELADVRGIVKRTRNGYDLRNDRVRETLIAAVDPGLVRNARRWMAQAIIETWDRPSDSLDDHVATLLSKSGDQKGAVEVLISAAHRQEERGDLRGAAERYARSLQMHRATGQMSPAEELHLCMATGRTSVHSLSLELGEWALHRAVELADLERNPHAGAEARVLLCRLLTRMGQLDTALERAREAVPLARRSDDRLMVAQVCAAIAENYQQQGDFGHDMDPLESALEIASEIGDVRRVGEYLQLAVVHAVGVGEYDRTRELLEQAQTIARENSDPLLACQLQKVEALLKRFSGDNEGALKINLKGVAMAHAHGLKEQEIIMLHNCGDNHLFMGREREALYFYSESLRRSKAARYDRLTEANEMFVGFLEVTYLGVETGLDKLRAAISSAERQGRLWNLNQGHRLLGQALMAMDNVESAVYHLREALRLAQETGVMFFIEQAASWLERAQRAAGAIR